MIDAPKIALDVLRRCLREQYGLVAVTLEFLPRGYDYRAGVFRAMSEDGDAYLLKVTSRPLYEPSCLVPRYLHNSGVSAVVAPLPTTSGSLWMTLAEWRVMVYPFLEGVTSLTGMTDQQWRETGRIFRRIHQTSLPPGRFPSIRTETFEPSMYLRCLQELEATYVPAIQAPVGGGGSAQALCASWQEHRATIHTALAALEHLGAALRSRALPMVIAHADLHPANVLRDPAGHVFVLDWDEVMLAPKERDFIFLRAPHASAFWQGYGAPVSGENEEVEGIDWVALTYFRWERVVQDLIEEAQQTLIRDDVSEGAKATAAFRFAATFARGNNVDAAYAAAAHLPRDLRGPWALSRKDGNESSHLW